MSKRFFFKGFARKTYWSIFIIVIGGFLAFYWIDSMCLNKQIDLTLKMAKSANFYTQELLRQEGSITANDKIIYAGSTKLNDDTKIVDQVKNTLGFGCTIFLRNKRVATTAIAKNDRNRAIGTRANENLADLVFNNGHEFSGITKSIGKTWVINCSPLYSRTGSRIGMLATYIEQDVFLSSMLYFRLLLGFSFVILCSILSGFIILEQQSSRYLSLQAKSINFKNLELEKKSVALKRALKREKELGQLKTSFVSVASHQFRTPLAIIQTNAELYEMLISSGKKMEIGECEKITGRITGEVTKMTELMDDVLVLGKLTSRNVHYAPKDTDLVEFCNVLIQQINSIQRDGRVLKFEFDGEPYKLNLDSKLLGHALSNLISNAFKYSQGKDNPKLKIHFKPEEVVLSIKDYGLGIPEKEHLHLFEPFFRAENAIEIQGTGLGLSIAKEYIEVNNGKISANSKLGEGSCFEVKLKNKNYERNCIY